MSETRIADRVQAAAAGLLALPHHDGSDAYVLERPQDLGDEAVLRLGVPHESAADRVLLRYVRDGEPRAAVAVVDAETETETWWRASLPALNPTTRYRWLLDRGDRGYSWLNGGGVSPRDLPDGGDFVLTLDPGGPDWHLDSVVYEIFPDRFATTGAAAGVQLPDWAVRRDWNARPEGRSRNTPRELFGGDLPGIEQRLDHVEQLGANVLYLTPVFPAGSNHRYDATSFDNVDPLLGGDTALASLIAAAHARGIRVIGDLTLNHCGVGHDWFLRGRENVNSPERDFFYFDDSFPHGYVSWFGVKSLPKLDHRSHELRRRLVDGPESVAGKWLRTPDGFDGWRIDVANMAGRHHDVDLTDELARAMRATLAAARSDALLVAEHGHDFRGDLQGFGWHGTMNYAGFLRPVWEWLRGDELPEELRRSFWGLPVGLPRVGGRDAAATMRSFRAGVPWASTLHSWTLLDSHDTARFSTVAGDRGRQLVGVGLQMTTPGVPMVFAGDELGLEGDWGEDARRTMPWDAPERWDERLHEAYRTLIRLRRGSDALARGSLRYVHVSDDAIAYLRETRDEQLLCLASRAPHEPIAVPFSELETLVGDDARNGVLPADGPAFHIWRIRNG
jgi:alpha-glucosidase